tara:strand:- start:249 stop:659 length:411 start_codon:yes stop_codon:yes gene_type:complete
MARKRIHGRKKRAPLKTVYTGPAFDMSNAQVQNPIGQIGGEDYTNYSPEQVQQQRMLGAEQMKRAQFEQQRMLQQQRVSQQQQQMQMPNQGGKDGAHSHSHRERTSGLGGIIRSVGRGKGGQSPSPYNSPYNTEEF